MEHGKPEQSHGNNSGTEAAADTDLTRRFADRSRALVEEHGADSFIGHLCKNINSQLRKLPGYVPHAWATHKSQPLQGKIKWQLDQLEAALQGR
jgi:hypothetical protein